MTDRVNRRGAFRQILNRVRFFGALNFAACGAAGLALVACGCDWRHSVALMTGAVGWMAMAEFSAAKAHASSIHASRSRRGENSVSQTGPTDKRFLLEELRAETFRSLYMPATAALLCYFLLGPDSITLFVGYATSVLAGAGSCEAATQNERRHSAWPAASCERPMVDSSQIGQLLSARPAK